MKVLISTPLFPPEIAYPAIFSKSFAENLSSHGHHVSVLAFANYPENIAGVKIITVTKNQNIFKRLFVFTQTLLKNIKNHDVIVLKQAGISSFITGLVAKIFNKKIILKLKEDEAQERIEKQHVKKNSFLVKRVKLLQNFVFKLSDLIIFDTETLKHNILKQYKIDGEKIKVYKHPEQYTYLPYQESNKQDEVTEWKKYIQNFETEVKKIYAK